MWQKQAHSAGIMVAQSAISPPSALRGKLSEL